MIYWSEMTELWQVRLTLMVAMNESSVAVYIIELLPATPYRFCVRLVNAVCADTVGNESVAPCKPGAETEVTLYHANFVLHTIIWDRCALINTIQLPDGMTQFQFNKSMSSANYSSCSTDHYIALISMYDNFWYRIDIRLWSYPCIAYILISVYRPCNANLLCTSEISSKHPITIQGSTKIV